MKGGGGMERPWLLRGLLRGLLLLPPFVPNLDRVILRCLGPGGSRGGGEGALEKLADCGAAVLCARRHAARTAKVEPAEAGKDVLSVLL